MGISSEGQKWRIRGWHLCTVARHTTNQEDSHWRRFLDYSCNGMPSKLVIPRGDSIVFLAINSLQSPCLPYRKLAAQALQTVKEHLEVPLLQVLSVSIPHLSPSVQSSPYSPLSASTPAGPAIQGSRFAPPAQLPSLKRHEVQFLPPHLRLRRDCCQCRPPGTRVPLWLPHYAIFPKPVGRFSHILV